MSLIKFQKANGKLIIHFRSHEDSFLNAVWDEPSNLNVIVDSYIDIYHITFTLPSPSMWNVSSDVTRSRRRDSFLQPMSSCKSDENYTSQDISKFLFLIFFFGARINTQVHFRSLSLLTRYCRGPGRVPTTTISLLPTHARQARWSLWSV